MSNFFLKYCFSFCLIFAAAFAASSINQNDIQLTASTQATLEEANIQNDDAKNFFTSNSEEDHKGFNRTIIENEIKTVKGGRLNNRISHINTGNIFGTTHYLNRVRNILPKYSLQTNISKCWYILYRVFRI